MHLLAEAVENHWILQWWPVISFFIIPIAGFLAWFVRREVKRWKKETIDEVRAATATIQPGANGGKSLSDANLKLDEILGMRPLMVELADTVRDLRDRQRDRDREFIQHLQQSHPAQAEAERI